MSFNLDGFINLHTLVKTLRKGKKAIRKFELDCPQRLKENFSRTVSPLTCFTMFSYVSWMTLAAFNCLFSPARNIHTGGLINKTER